uniref:Endoribonuclease YbeY n=1 Tax=Thermodesulfovibrio aggregans TaxID=86166 RepID=A0A7C4ELI2_9BACT
MKLNVEVINRQRKVKISLKRLKNNSKKIFKILLEFQDKKFLTLLKKDILFLSISIVLIGNEKMKELNFKYRNMKTTTDVLSFTYEELYENEFFLGEIFINPGLAKSRAIQNGLTLYHEINRVLVHGILHLLGYDHEKSVYHARKMQRLEEDILKKLQA